MTHPSENYAHLRVRLGEAEAELDRLRRGFVAAFDHLPVPMAVLDDRLRIERVNDAFAGLLGRADRAVGLDLVDLLHPDDASASAGALRLLAAGDTSAVALDVRLAAAGSPRWCRLALAPVPDPAGRTDRLVVLAQDDTARREAEAALRQLALHDPLTDLPSRRLLVDRLEHAAERARRSGGSLAVIAVDLERWDEVARRYGTEGADRVLEVTARRLRSIVRASDTVSRYGNDELALLCEDLTAAEADVLAQRVRDAVSVPISLAQGGITVRARVGVVVAGGAGLEDPNRLLWAVDADVRRCAGPAPEPA